ncbi:UNVERIFIED_CONTAM: hypothetical protein GTU68_031544 [Idotea baltica]|nr:hypothetical protein [Idotea baltica]
MQVEPTGIEGLFIITPNVYEDERGAFYESFNHRKFLSSNLNFEFVQDNISVSSYGVIRGMHFQAGDFAQAKLVHVINGSVLDIALDLRANSSTYGKHFSIELSSINKKQLLIPRGFAHGFSVLSETATFYYKCDNFYSKENERGITPKDNYLNFDWKIDVKSQVISERDLLFPTFNSYKQAL